MNIFSLSTRDLKAQPFYSLLTIFLVSFAVAILCMLILIGSQLESGLAKNAKNIDLVIGAKGSPLQMILAAVYHQDLPTGNISLQQVEQLKANRLIKNIIPLSLGDTYQGYRIVGTRDDFIALYEARAASAHVDKNCKTGRMQVVLGAVVASQSNLRIGDKFAGTHGLGDTGDEHIRDLYTVTCILQRTGTVIDRLIVTSLESVWDIHDESEHHFDKEDASLSVPASNVHMQNAPDHVDDVAKNSNKLREITYGLIQYSSPLAALSLPRFINEQTNIQSAAPAIEMARLNHIIGIGEGVLTVLGSLFLLIAAMILLSGLMISLRIRQSELAILRMLGASRKLLFASVVIESWIVSCAGLILGLVMAHVALALIGQFLPRSSQFVFSAVSFDRSEWLIVLLTLSVSWLAATIPAWYAANVDVCKGLSE